MIHYNLQLIITVGLKVNNEKDIQFYKWANDSVKDYTIEVWSKADEQLKNGGSVLEKEYFEQLFEQIREFGCQRKIVSENLGLCYCWEKIINYHNIKNRGR